MWFEWLFKYSAETYAQGRLAFDGPLGAGWWALAAVLLALSAALSHRPLRSRALAAVRRLLPRAVGDSWSAAAPATPLDAVAPARRAPIFLLQLLAVAVLLTVLGAPVLEVSRLAPGASSIAVLVDASASMALPAGSGEAADSGAEAGRVSRLALAKRLVRSDIAEAAERLPGAPPLALFHFDQTLQRAPSLAALGELRADGARSRLVDALTDLAENYDGALGAIVVLTDGAQNGGDRTGVEALAETRVPTHVIGIGPELIVGDVELADLTLPASAAPNATVTARAVLRHALPSGGEVRLRIRDGNSVLAAESVRLDPQTPLVVRDIAFDSGAASVKELVVELDTPSSDPLPANNVRTRLLEVVETRHRVLYLEGEPRWEFKFIRRALAEDDQVRLLSWLRTTPRKTYRQGVLGEDELASGFPATLQALYEFDLVILGSLPATAFDDTQHAWLERFVAERGGSLLALAGNQALAAGGWDVAPLAQVLPTVLDRQRDGAAYALREVLALPTADGAASPLTDISGEGASERDALWRSLPPLLDYQPLGRVKPGATVYLEAEAVDRGWREARPAPLLVAQPYGLGRSAVLATASTWRWQMRTPPDDRRHSLFWRQLVRHLASTALPQRRLEVAAEGGRLALRASFKDAEYRPLEAATATARVTAPGRHAFDVALAPAEAPGTFEAELDAFDAAHSGAEGGTPGVYRIDLDLRTPGALASDNTITRLVRVGAESPEVFAATRNQSLLERIAEATGGRVWQPGDLSGLHDAIAFGAAGLREQQRLPLWDAPFFFLLLVLAKCAEWSLRRLWGGI